MRKEFNGPSFSKTKPDYMWRSATKIALADSFSLRRNDAEIWLSAFCHAQC